LGSAQNALVSDAAGGRIVWTDNSLLTSQMKQVNANMLGLVFQFSRRECAGVSLPLAGCVPWMWLVIIGVAIFAVLALGVWVARGTRLAVRVGDVMKGFFAQLFRRPAAAANNQSTQPSSDGETNRVPGGGKPQVRTDPSPSIASSEERFASPKGWTAQPADIGSRGSEKEIQKSRSAVTEIEREVHDRRGELRQTQKEASNALEAERKQHLIAIQDEIANARNTLAEQVKIGKTELTAAAATVQDNLRLALDDDVARARADVQSLAASQVFDELVRQSDEFFAKYGSAELEVLTLLATSPQLLKPLAQLVNLLAADPTRLRNVTRLLEQLPEESNRALLDGAVDDEGIHPMPSDELLRQSRKKYAELQNELLRIPDGSVVVEGLASIGALGSLAESSLRALLKAAGQSDPVQLIMDLPAAAQAEFRESYRTVFRFGRFESAICRRLVQGIIHEPQFGRIRHATPFIALSRVKPFESTFLESSGWMSASRPVAERLRDYFEPFDRAGALDKFVVAWQYLFEAYPREQLSKEQCDALRGSVESPLGDTFHGLVGTVAAGLQLTYRPVPYYDSDLLAPEFDFIQRSVESLNLSERSGVASAAKPSEVVRLQRPFFFLNDRYYAGHAYVSR
jgi:hypothetical protein